MSRIDIPTLQCDRCRDITQDMKEMPSFRKLTYYHMSGHDEWDMCPTCWAAFLTWMEGKK